MAATLAHPLTRVLITDPGTTRHTNPLADTVLPAVQDDFNRLEIDGGDLQLDEPVLFVANHGFGWRLRNSLNTFLWN